MIFSLIKNTKSTRLKCINLLDFPNDYVINLYADAALTVPYTQVRWANSAATAWQVNPSYAGSWRLDEFYVPNIGTKTYFTTNLTTNTTTVAATWTLANQKFYTRFVQDQQILH